MSNGVVREFLESDILDSMADRPFGAAWRELELAEELGVPMSTLNLRLNRLALHGLVRHQRAPLARQGWVLTSAGVTEVLEASR